MRRVWIVLNFATAGFCAVAAVAMLASDRMTEAMLEGALAMASLALGIVLLIEFNASLWTETEEDDPDPERMEDLPEGVVRITGRDAA